MDFLVDMTVNDAPLLTELLNSGIKVLAYNGDLDWICNWIGGQYWVNDLDWKGKEQFNEIKFSNIGYGLKRQYENFAFVRFSDAGHMVPMDQPKNALLMLTQFMDGEMFN